MLGSEHLKKKVGDMELLVKGLIEETLDLKSVVLTMFKEADEFSRQEDKRGTIVRGTASPALAVPTVFPSVAAPTEPAMSRIMQSDGTMKLEVRCGDKNQIDSCSGYGPTRMAHL